jgi:hypothetical protein
MNEGNVHQRVDGSKVVSLDDYRMRSRAWICSTCQLAVTSPEPIAVPPQCKRCGAIAFGTISAKSQR